MNKTMTKRIGCKENLAPYSFPGPIAPFGKKSQGFSDAFNMEGTMVPLLKTLLLCLVQGTPVLDVDCNEETSAPLVQLAPSNPTIGKLLTGFISVKYHQVPLTIFLEDFGHLTGIPLTLDKTAVNLRELKVTIRVEDISVKSVLKLTLQQIRLTYILRDQDVLIISEEGAKNVVKIAHHPIEDLVGDSQEKREELIGSILNCVEPDSWNRSGQQTAISYEAQNKSLLIIQTEDVHEEIRAFLAAWRSLGFQPIGPPPRP
jgi:hypothetical protein